MTMPDADSSGPLSFSDLPIADDREAAWQLLLDHGPVVDVDDQLLVVGLAEVEQVLRDPEVFSAKLALETLGSPLPLVPLAFDPPEHTRYRRILQPFFTNQRVEHIHEGVRGQLADLIDAMAIKGGGDVVEEIAVPFPSLVFLTLFGLPLEDLPRLLVWKDGILGALGPEDDAPTLNKTAPGELFEYLTEKIADRRGRAGGHDVLSELLDDASDEALNDEEILGLAFLLVIAGLDTMTGAIAFALTRLAKDPQLRARIVGDPSLIPAFVEETVRLDPADFALVRVTTREVELGGRVIPAGNPVFVVLSTANRDATHFPDPTAVDLGETRPLHLGFGYGAHRCIGVHLARAELRLFVEEWHKRIPDYHLEPGFEPELLWPAAQLHFPSVRVVIP